MPDEQGLYTREEALAVMERLKISQHQMERLTGLWRTTIRRWVSGETQGPARETRKRVTAVLMEAEGKELTPSLKRYLSPKVRREQEIVKYERQRGVISTMLTHGTGIPGCRMCPIPQQINEKACSEYQPRNINCPVAARLFLKVVEDCQEDKMVELKADKYAYEVIAKLVVRIRYADQMLELLGWERPDTEAQAGKRAKWWIEQQDRWTAELGRWFDRCGFSRAKRELLRRYAGNDLATMFSQTIDVEPSETVEGE